LRGEGLKTGAEEVRRKVNRPIIFGKGVLFKKKGIGELTFLTRVFSGK